MSFLRLFTVHLQSNHVSGVTGWIQENFSSFPRSFGATNCLPGVITAVFTEEIPRGVVRALLPGICLLSHLAGVQSSSSAWHHWKKSQPKVWPSPPQQQHQTNSTDLFMTCLAVNSDLLPTFLSIGSQQTSPFNKRYHRAVDWNAKKNVDAP